jgi:two-component system invasion response regulator UvrY
MTEIMVIERQQLVRAAVGALLQQWQGFEVVACLGYEDEVLREARARQPEVVVMGVGAFDGTAISIIERLTRAAPDCGVVALAAHSQPPLPTHLIELGVRGFVTVDNAPNDLREAVQAVASGSMFVGPEAAQQLALSMLPGQHRSPFQRLTPRELEVAMLMMQGLRMPAMAEQIRVSPKTVATYKYRIYEKLAVRTEVDLLRLAMRHGLVASEGATVH